MFRILCGTEIFLLTACKFLQHAAGHTAPPDPGEGPSLRALAGWAVPQTRDEMDGFIQTIANWCPIVDCSDMPGQIFCGNGSYIGWAIFGQ